MSKISSTDGQYSILRDSEIDKYPDIPLDPNFRRNGILTLLGGVCIHLVLGTFYLWGAIAQYVASYLRSMDSSVTLSGLMSITPMTGIGLNIGQLLGLPLAERFGFRLVTFVCVVTIALAVFLTSFATSYNLFVLFYGILNGLATGHAYMIPVVSGWKYFPNNKGLVSGIIIGAFGFGSFIFNFVATGVVNPDNLKPTEEFEGAKYFPKEVYERVPRMFVILSICYLALGVVGTLLIRVPKVPAEARPSQPQTSSDAIVPPRQGCKSVKDGVLSFPFLILLIIGSSGLTFGLFMANNYKIYGMIKIPEDRFITMVGSVGAVFNGGTRAFWSGLFDKHGFKKVYFFLIVFQMILCATFDFISYSKPLYLIWFCLLMSCEGGHFSLLPSVTAKIFGIQFGPKIYGYLFWFFAIASWSTLGLTKLALNYIGWTPVFYISTGITGIAFIANFFVQEKYTGKD